MGTMLQSDSDLDIDGNNKGKRGPLDPQFDNNEGYIQKYTTKKPKQVSYFTLYRYSSLKDRIYLLTAITCAIIAGSGNPVLMIFFGDITGDIVEFAMHLYDSNSTNMTDAEAEEALMNSLTSYAINCGILGVAIFCLTYISVVLFTLTCVRQVRKIRASYMKNILNQDIGWYDLNQTGDFSSRITEDILKIEEGLGDKVSNFLFFMSNFFVGVVIALVYGWKLALICLISFPVNTIALGVVTWLTTKFSLKEMELYGSAGAIAEEVLGAIKTIFAFNGQQKETERYKEHLVKACNNNIKRAFLTGLSNALMWFFIYASYALSFYYGIGLVLDERHLPPEQQTYNAGTMITIFFCVFMSNFTLTQCMPYFQIFGTAKGAATKIFNVIDNTPVINLSKNKGKKIKNFKGIIKFENIEFNYPARMDVKILKKVSFEVLPGETVALVGGSGCGKSTCIQLLQRYYDPLSGKITIDNTDIKELDLTWLRSKIGVVGQEPVLFTMTVGENIKFGNSGATEEDIVRAARKANAHPFISELPDGYKTLVGERGSKLSGGQKQRIAIARALVREPAILLLDEATSALDTKSEAEVQRAIDSISQECTTIIIAHRLSTIKNASKIIVFSEGEIAEMGTHEQLMALKGIYYNLVITQISRDETDSIDSKHSNDTLPEEEKVKDEFDRSEMLEVMESENKNVSAICSVLALNKPEWWQVTIGAISAIIAGAALPVYAVVFGDVMGVFSLTDPDEVRREGNTFSLYFLIIGVISGIVTFFQWYMIGFAGEKLTKRVRGLMFETILRQEPAWFDRKENGVGALCAKLSSDAANIQGAAGHPIVVALNSLSTLVIAIGLSLFYEWRLALVSMALMPFTLIGTYFEMKFTKLGSYSKNSLESSTKIAVDAVSNIRTVASLGCEETFYNLFTTELVPYYKKAERTSHFRGLILGLARTFFNIAYIVAMYYGGILIINEKLDYVLVFKVSESLVTAAWSVGNVMSFSPNFQKAIVATNKMFALVKREVKIKDGPDSKYSGWTKGHINYKQIKFSYPTRPNLTILDSLDLDILQGKTVALVGPSGCGKSTIIQLLQRFYDPSSGTVSIDDINLKNIKIPALRSHLGIVSQEPNLFDRTIAENIAYGDNNRIVRETEIIEAAKNANIHNFVKSLPLGYETRLGERGAQLSGGQKQRIAIARALVRNPNILLLDEATSALDMESEKVVQEALDKAKVGRTCITIAHRLTTIQDADVICVMNKGKVVEQGTHNELLALKGLYYKLQAMQRGQK